jgi:hypothetical protein
MPVKQQWNLYQNYKDETQNLRHEIDNILEVGRFYPIIWDLLGKIISIF